MKRVHVNCGAKYQAAFTEFLRLIGQVITVSLETQKIASDLPELAI